MISLLAGYTGADRFYLQYNIQGAIELVLLVFSLFLILCWVIVIKQFNYEKLVGSRQRVAYWCQLFFQYSGATLFIGSMVWYLIDIIQVVSELNPERPTRPCLMCWFT
jgi:hypothetical protein